MNTELNSVANQYAQAILDLAVKQTQADETIYLDLKAINQIVSGTPLLGTLLHHPAISKVAKKNYLLNLFKGKAHELTLRLLQLLADNRRLDLLPRIERNYHQLLNQRLNIVSASLTSCEPLSDSQVANIKARLAEHLGKKLELKVKVDKSLLGGVVLTLQDQVIDGSLKGKLRTIEKLLLSA